MNNDELNNLLNQVASILLRCFLLTYALLLIWFFMMLFAGNWAYGIQACLFDISRHDFALTNYLGIAFTKICAIVFFLFPYISIKIVQKKKGKQTSSS